MTVVSDPVKRFVPPPLETSTLRQRLLQGVGGSNAARGSLSKCAIQYRQFLSKYRGGDADADTIETLKQDLIHEFDLYQIEMRKMVLSIRVAHVDTEYIDREITDVESEIQKTRFEIEELRNKYPEAKKIRRNLEEFETISKKANQRPPRFELEKSIDEVNGRLRKVEDNAQKNRDEKALREKQFHLFMQSLFDLKESLAEDDDNNNNAQQQASSPSKKQKQEEDGGGEVKAMDLT
eukprot:CAMPEP_0194165248 /NCGR_PEP_ID=MMETSP0154-20130528/1230_1 /TAXON_ID=1049557 /ORGANISM="Thalassiothrix antarctica, Strain L6-D1" /LENGTH=235 /DNA_ID=CAMNT_0038875643 /DNA_START=77 /DNA_END=784 /DNA_ORIENTATION=+